MLLVTLLLVPLVFSSSQEAATTGANRSDEPLIDQFSLQRAVAFSDASALQWEQQRDCVTCGETRRFGGDGATGGDDGRDAPR